jgi:hypothetical protein
MKVTHFQRAGLFSTVLGKAVFFAEKMPPKITLFSAGFFCQWK